MSYGDLVVGFEAEVFAIGIAFDVGPSFEEERLRVTLAGGWGGGRGLGTSSGGSLFLSFLT